MTEKLLILGKLKIKTRYICDYCYTGEIFDGKLCNKSMYFNHCYCKQFLVEDLGIKMEDIMDV